MPKKNTYLLMHFQPKKQQSFGTYISKCSNLKKFVQNWLHFVERRVTEQNTQQEDNFLMQPFVIKMLIKRNFLEKK